MPSIRFAQCLVYLINRARIYKMKKIIFSLVLILVSTVSYAKTYKCTGYSDGKVVGESIKINASKTAIAETKAADRIRKREEKEGKKGKVGFVRCNEV